MTEYAPLIRCLNDPFVDVRSDSESNAYFDAALERWSARVRVSQSSVSDYGLRLRVS